MFFPNICQGCGSDKLHNQQILCLHCISVLPKTGFENLENNPLEKIFTGRIQLSAAWSQYYFTKGKLIQQLIHLFKYKQQSAIGSYLGEIMGESLLSSSRLPAFDYLVPLPLFADKEFKRGYNQAEIICKGISNTTSIPLHTNNVVRKRATQTQTRKHRTERWENVAGSFHVKSPEKIHGKHILLVDDVVTTGATLEACGQVILDAGASSLSFATLAIAGK